MDGKMTLETALSVIDRSIHALREAGYPAQADELTEARVPVSAQFAQPSQAVDVGAIQEVIDDLREWGETDKQLATRADKLTRAIGNAQAEGK